MVDDVLRMRATIQTEESLAKLREWGREIGYLPNKVKPGIKSLNTEFATLSGTIRKLGGELREAIPALGAFGFGAAGAAVASGALIETLTGAAKRVVELKYASKELGMSERDIRAWGAAAEQVGISSQSMQTGLQAFKKTTDGLRYNIGGTRDELYALGAGPIVQRMQAATTQAEKLKVAFDFKEQLMKSDPSGFKARMFFEQIGLGADKARLSYEEWLQTQAKVVAVTPEQQKAAKEFNDQLIELGEKWDTLKIKVGVKLFPFLSEELKEITDGFSELWRIITGIREGKPIFAPDFFGKKKPEDLTAPPATFNERWMEDKKARGKLTGEWDPELEKRGAVPKFQRGGIVTRPTHALIGEAGPEAIIPLSANFGASADLSKGERMVKAGVFAALVDFQSYVAAGGGELAGLGAAGGMGFGGGGGGRGGGGGGDGGGGRGGGGGGDGGGGRGGGGGGGGRGGDGGGTGVVDQTGKPVDPQTVAGLKQLAASGNTAGMRSLMTSKGYRVDSAWCGDLARALVGGSGFQVPKGYPVASTWRGIGEHAEPASINEPGREFGSIIMSKTNVPIGQTGGHVATVVPGTYDAKSKTVEVVDTHGRWRRALSGFELRILQKSPEGIAAAGGQAPASVPAVPGAPAAGGRGVSDYVKFWESFKAHPFQDVGGVNIGYGTRARPGETTISEPEAARRMNEELAKNRAAIEKMNPNLPEGSKKALTSLLYNLGGDTKKLQEHGMASAIAANNVEAMKKAHLEFSHIHGPQGPILRGLRARREDELKFYDEQAANSRRIDQHINGNGKAEGEVHVQIHSNGTAARTRTRSKGGLFQKTTIQNHKQMQPTSTPVGTVAEAFQEE